MRILTYFILVFFLVFSCNLFSQTQISITTPQLEHVDNELIIEYEILNSQSKDIFIVWLEITDASGNTIKAGAFSGDR